MTSINFYSKALERHFSTGRYIGHLSGEENGPSLIFLAGIHGNEPAGVIALQQALTHLQENNINTRGNIHALAGNLPALAQGKRYLAEDLNRLWQQEQVASLLKDDYIAANEDQQQQLEIYRCIEKILREEEGPFYFIDLHSTSSETIPFAILNDSLLNRRFTSQYPLPLILGIEEYIEGPLLSYINELGYLAFGFEGGQHDEASTIENHYAFVLLTLALAGVIALEDIAYNHCRAVLARQTVDTRAFFEILYRFRVKESDHFAMEPGYVNFQNVKKGEKLAVNNGKNIIADRDAKVFMPLYQSQGSEGFYAIRRVPRFFLKTSSTLRKMGVNRILPYLPGVHWYNREREELEVNRKLARFFTKEIFHLMGYRSYRLNHNHLLMSNREAVSREVEYHEEAWWPH